MITILQNPTKAELLISSANKEIRTIELELLNSSGQQVIKSKMNMDASSVILLPVELPNGSYQARIRCSNFLIYKKVIITK